MERRLAGLRTRQLLKHSSLQPLSLVHPGREVVQPGLPLMMSRNCPGIEFCNYLTIFLTVLQYIVLKYVQKKINFQYSSTEAVYFF